MIYQSADLHNVAEIFKTENTAGKSISRVPLDVRSQLNESAQANAIQATGCEIRFNLQSESAAITLEMTERPAIAEVYFGPFLSTWHVIQTHPTTLQITSPPNLDLLCDTAQKHGFSYDPQLTRVILPWRPPVLLHDIQGEMHPPDEHQTPSRTYLAYGSSITHGNNSMSASSMFARRTAQHLDVDLINMGFGGGAHCEASLARYIAGRDDWDFATLELGINMVGWMDVPDFEKRVLGFIKPLTDAHPDKWIFCIDMFPFYMDFDLNSEKNHAYRAVVRETVAALGAPRLVHIDGRDLLRDIRGLCADLVHPSPAGMEEIAQNLSSRIQRFIEGKGT